jgi:colicin import membrane protein
VETSAMASIEDLLREHERHVEREWRDAVQRAEMAEQARRDAQQRAVEEAARMAREADEGRRRREFEEQRRTAEIIALQQATAERVRSEAASQARLAELAVQQEHERHLHALTHDRSKKRWKVTAALVAITLVLAVGIGGYQLHATAASARAAEVELASLRAQIADAEHDKAALHEQILKTTDPEQIAALQAKLTAKDATIADLERRADGRPPKGAAAPQGTMATTTPATHPTAPPVCHCMDGDPTCSCIR